MKLYLKQSQIPALHFEWLLVQLQHIWCQLGHIKPGPPVGHLPKLTPQQWPQNAPPQPESLTTLSSHDSQTMCLAVRVLGGFAAMV